MPEEDAITRGGCLCGAVRYQVRGPLRDIINCHCSMCRRLHGSFGPHSKARKEDMTITKSDGLTWYETSPVARRGFCGTCGARLFWEPYESDATCIVAGTLDDPARLNTVGHVFVGEKPDFYEITDDLPQFEGSSTGQLEDDNY